MPLSRTLPLYSDDSDDEESCGACCEGVTTLQRMLCVAVIVAVLPIFYWSWIEYVPQTPGEDGLTYRERSHLDIVLVPHTPHPQPTLLQDGLRAKADSGNLLGQLLPIRGNETNVSISAFIVDTYADDRSNCAIVSVMRNLPAHARIVVFHPSDQKSLKQTLLKDHIASGKVELYDVGVSLRHFSFLVYSSLCQMPVLYEAFATEHILFFQADSVLCARTKHRLEEFLPYDYIGGPWAWDLRGLGNGGLSLRKRRRMVEILTQHNKHVSVYEDMVISNLLLADKSSVIPDFETRSHFSVESVFYCCPYGLHQIWHYEYSDHDMSLLINSCPALSCVLELVSRNQLVKAG